MSCELNSANQKRLADALSVYDNPKEAMEAVKHALAVDSKAAKLDAIAKANIKNSINEYIVRYSGKHKKLDDEALRGEATAAMLVGDKTGRSGIESIEQLKDAVESRYLAELSPLTEYLKVDLLGNPKNTLGLDNTLKELDGISTGDSKAKAAADAWLSVSEKMRVEKNSLGADIGKIDGPYIPQAHDIYRIDKAGKDVWKRDVMSLMGEKGLKNTLAANPGKTIDQVLDSVYNGVKGNVEVKTGDAVGFSSFAARKDNHNRKLFFESAGKQQDYHASYGTYGTDLRAAMVTHVTSSAREIGLLRKLGANPEDTIKSLNDEGFIRLDYSSNLQSSLPDVSSVKNNSLWQVVSGNADKVSYDDATTAKLLSDARSVLTASKLGSAPITAVPTDIASSMVNAGFYDFSGFGIIKEFFTSGKYTKQEQQEFGADLSLLNDIGAGGDRLGDVTNRQSAAGTAASSVLKVSGLVSWTDKMRVAVVLNIARTYGKNAKKTFDKLSSGNKAFLQDNGITSKEWDTIRTTAIGKDGKLNPALIKDLRLQDKWRGAVIKEQHTAIPTPGDYEKTVTSFGGNTKGTGGHELGKTTTQFLSTPMKIYFTQMARIFKNNQGAKAGAKFAAKSYLAATAAGYVALSVNSMLNGKGWINPADMNADQILQLWLASSVKGGSFGFFGDAMLEAALSDGYNTDLDDRSSPLFSTGAKFVDVFNEPAKIPKAILTELPGQNLWYTKLLYNRLIVDTINDLFNPKGSRKSNRSKIKRARTETNSNFWWKPGDLSPF